MIQRIVGFTLVKPEADIILEKATNWNFNDTGYNTIANFQTSTGFKNITDVQIRDKRIYFNIDKEITSGIINLDAYSISNLIKLDVPNVTGISINNNRLVTIEPKGNLNKVESFSMPNIFGTHKVNFNIDKFPALKKLIISNGLDCDGVNIIGTCPKLLKLEITAMRMTAEDYEMLMPFAESLVVQPDPYQFFKFTDYNYDLNSPQFIALKNVLTSKGKIVTP